MAGSCSVREFTKIPDTAGQETRCPSSSQNPAAPNQFVGLDLDQTAAGHLPDCLRLTDTEENPVQGKFSQCEDVFNAIMPLVYHQ